MDIYLTKGLKGKKLGCLYVSIVTYENAMYAINVWKENNSAYYQIAPYVQLTISDDCIGVDFGDHCTFMLIDNISDTEWKDINKQLKRNSNML